MSDRNDGHPGAAPGAGGPTDEARDVATLLRTVDLEPRESVDVDALIAAAGRRRRLRTIERTLAVAATVALVAAVGLGVAHLRAPVTTPGPAASGAVALPRTVLGPESAYPYAVPLGTPGGKPTVVVWTDPQSPLSAQFSSKAGSALRALAEQGRIYLVVRAAIFLDDALPQSNNASLRAVETWGCVLDAEPVNLAGTSEGFLDRVLADQPAVEGAGWTDDQLAALAAETLGRSGSPGTSVSACMESGTYAAWAKASQHEMTVQGVAGVPTVYVDGAEVVHDGSASGWDAFVADPGAWIAAHS